MAAMVVVAAALFAVVFAGSSHAAVVEHTFVVSQVSVRHLCEDTVVTVVNGQLPGPAIEATEGDSVVVHVLNQSPVGVTIHWHGVRQRFNCWADGVGMVTQCPIAPNASFTYRFDVAGHEGTLWWHAHNSALRGTIHGAIIIRPKSGSYPGWFPKTPDVEVPIIIADFFQMDLGDLETDLETTSVAEPAAATINGRVGDPVYNCSGSGVAQDEDDGFVLDVEPGKTYLLRLVNAALFPEFYFKVAGHKLTVVAADANYVLPYTTQDAVAIAPGETLDVLMVADAPPGRNYYMAAQAIQPPKPQHQLPVYITRGQVRYNKQQQQQQHIKAEEPVMPDQHDQSISFFFRGNLTGRPDLHPLLPQVRGPVDERLFIILGLGTIHDRSLDVAYMNNVSFRLPRPLALLEARYHGVPVETEELPATPPTVFDFIDPALINLYNRSEKLLELEPTRKATTTRRFAYGSAVEVVFQSTSVQQNDPNPMHLHGHDMFLLAQGHGIYDAARDVAAFNLVDPQVRNTVMVPRLGWAAVRFVADNPGTWLLHCHFEFHVAMGMATVFEVANGPTPETALRPPPADFPRCHRGFAYA